MQALLERYRNIESNCQLYVTEKYERSFKKNPELLNVYTKENIDELINT